jgi:predicted DNA-binding ribbon-helix-helix protein
MGSQMKDRLSVRIESDRLEKLRRVAKQKRKTMTQLIEDWIDRIQDIDSGSSQGKKRGNYSSALLPR